MKIKKALALLLALCLTLAMVPATAFAESETSGTCGKNLTWSFDESTGTLTISGTGAMTSSPWSNFKDQIIHINIEEGVTSIRDNAFGNCGRLLDVHLPETLRSIGGYAFSKCEKLSSIRIPDATKYFGFFAFYDCAELKRVDYSNLRNWCLIQFDSWYSNPLCNGADLYFDGVIARNIEIPDDFDGVGVCQFQGCASITNVTIPMGVTRINAIAFEGCKNLVSVSIPDTVNFIGDYAFESSGIKSLRIPDTVTVVSGNLCHWCYDLEEVTIGRDVTRIEGAAFNTCTSLERVKYRGDRPSYYGIVAFSFTPGIKEIYYPAGNASWQEYLAGYSGSSLYKAYSINDYYDGSYVKPPVDHGDTIVYNGHKYVRYDVDESLTWQEAKEYCETLGGHLATITSEAEQNAVESIVVGGKSDQYWLGAEKTYNRFSEGEWITGEPWTYENWVFSKDITHHNNLAMVRISNSDTINDARALGRWDIASGENYGFICEFDESLASLEPIDFLALSDLTFTNTNAPMGTTIREILKDKWNKQWYDTSFTYADIFERVADWTIAMKSSDENTNSDISKTGFFAYAFRNSLNEVVVAFRGSQPIFTEGAWADWWDNDLRMMFGGEGPQVRNAFNFYSSVLAEINPRDCVVTGHSLGGGLANIISAAFYCKCFSFDSAPFLDIGYWYLPEELANGFTGVNTYIMLDYSNEDDALVGNQSDEKIKPKKLVKNHFWDGASLGFYPHLVEALVREVSGKPELAEPTVTRISQNVINQYISIGFDTTKRSIMLGTSQRDIMSGLLSHWVGFWKKLPHKVFGGLGNDSITLDDANDWIAGGLGDDTINGGLGNDTYYYRKGDGLDTIDDFAGNDRIILSGFESDAKIDLKLNDENYVILNVDGEDIISINSSRSYPHLGIFGRDENSFILELKLETGERREIGDLEEYLTSFDYMFTKRVEIACPVDVEIFDKNTNEVVYTVQDGIEGNFYTDYGCFYVFQEEGSDEYAKVLDIVNGYDFRICGNNSGEMGVAAYDFIGNELSDPYIAFNVPVTPTMVATIEEVGEQKNLVIDYDGDGVTDSVVPLAAPVVVSFDANGGTGEMAEVSVAAGGAYKLPECGFIAPEGQTFQGWDVNGTVYAPGEKITVTENVTIKALWSAASGGVTPPSGESGGSQTPPTQGPVPTVTPPSTGGASGSTTAPSTRPTSPNDTPRTGDFSAPALWVCLMAASGLAAAVLAHTGKKKRK